MINNYKNYIKTSDLALSTALSLFFPLESVELENSGKSIFIFDRNSKTEEIIEKFWNGTLLVNPLQYFQQLKVLKSRIYAER